MRQDTIQSFVYALLTPKLRCVDMPAFREDVASDSQHPEAAWTAASHIARQGGSTGTLSRPKSHPKRANPTIPERGARLREQPRYAALYAAACPDDVLTVRV